MIAVVGRPLEIVPNRSTAVADVEIGVHRTMIPSPTGSDNNSIK
ncbi:hypothetical protein ABZ805_13025 [Saccharopolyspora sp. NPDC047091]